MNKVIQRWVRFAIYLGALFIIVVGTVFHVDQMYLMALALALLPSAAWLVGRALVGGVISVRSLPDLCAVGESVPVTLTVTNVARLTRPALRVSDVLPRALRPVGERAPLLLNLLPGEVRMVSYQILPERRGRHSIGPTRIGTTDPLGLWAFDYPTGFGRLSELAVYPILLPLRHLFWEDAAISGAHSREAAQRRGNGMEFHGVREYQPGDELRHVHWRTTARTGKLSVAEYAQGSGRDTVIALDLSRSAYVNTGTGAESAIESAVTLAASAAAHLLRRGSAVRLLTALDWDDAAPPAVGPAALTRILEVLVGAEAEASLSLAQTLTRARRVAASGATLICITPQPADPALAGALAGLRARGTAVFGLALKRLPMNAVPRDGDVGETGLWRAARPGDDLAKILEG